jgi:hypothetical protein
VGYEKLQFQGHYDWKGYKEWRKEKLHYIVYLGQLNLKNTEVG